MSTGVFVGRFQPFHKGHITCVEHILQEKDVCIIFVRYASAPNEKNPFDLQDRIAMIRREFPDEARVKIIPLEDEGLDLTVFIGRDVGYQLIQLDASIEGISATDIRKKLYAEKQVLTNA